MIEKWSYGERERCSGGEWTNRDGVIERWRDGVI